MPPPPPHPTLLGKRHMRLPDGIGVVVVLLGLGQEEHVFVVGRRTGLDGRRHGIGLVPDDVAAEDPTGVHQRQDDSPGHPQLLAILVLVAQDDPQRAGIRQDALTGGKDTYQPLNIRGGSRLVPQLCGTRVVPLPEIGRTGHDRIDHPVRQSAELFQRVTTQDRVSPRFVTHASTPPAGRLRDHGIRFACRHSHLVHHANPQQRQPLLDRASGHVA